MKNIIILGSGRSGTSMVAGLFAQAGYFFGGTVYPPRHSNPKGFFETKAVNDINEEILARVVPRRPVLIGNLIFRSRPGKSQRWLARVPLNTEFTFDCDISDRIKRLTDTTPFCFKDPRFSYTLPVWRPCLDNNVFLCVFRHPAVTVTSILRECATAGYLKDLRITPASALNVWSLMYTHILQKHAGRGSWMFIHYDQVFDSRVMEKVAAVIDVDIDYSFPEKELNRSAPMIAVDGRAMDIYRRLCERADYSPRE